MDWDFKMNNKAHLYLVKTAILIGALSILAPFNSAASTAVTRIYTHDNKVLLKLDGDLRTKNYTTFCTRFAHASPDFSNKMKKVLLYTAQHESEKSVLQIVTSSYTKNSQWCEYVFSNHISNYSTYNNFCKTPAVTMSQLCSSITNKEALSHEVTTALLGIAKKLDQKILLKEAKSKKQAAISKAKKKAEINDLAIEAKIKAQKIRSEGKLKADNISAEACKKDFERVTTYDKQELKLLKEDLTVIAKSLSGKKYRHVSHMLSSVNTASPLIDSVDGACFQFDNYSTSHKEIMSEYSRLKTELAHLQSKYDIAIQKIKEQKEASQARVKKAPTRSTIASRTTRQDINKLTTYAVIIGRAIGCSVNTDAAVNRVTTWFDKKFPPGSPGQKKFLIIFMGGIEHHVKEQVRGNSPDNCQTVKREYSLMSWP